MANKIIILFISVLALLGGLFSSCYYDNEMALYGSTPCDTTTVVFSLDIVPIMESNCYICHSNANASNSGGSISLEGYSNIILNVVIGNADASSLYGSIAWLPGFNQMPKGQSQISDCDLSKVRKWINDGAVNI